MRRLAETYADRSDVLFLVVYQREPHAGQMSFEDVEQPTTAAERRALALRLKDEFPMDCPWLLDGLDDQSRAHFGDLPSPAVVIAPNGKVAIKLPWSEPDVLEARLATWFREPSLTDWEPTGGARVLHGLYRDRAEATTDAEAWLETHGTADPKMAHRVLRALASHALRHDNPVGAGECLWRAAEHLVRLEPATRGPLQAEADALRRRLP